MGLTPSPREDFLSLLLIDVKGEREGESPTGLSASRNVSSSSGALYHCEWKGRGSGQVIPSPQSSGFSTAFTPGPETGREVRSPGCLGPELFWNLWEHHPILEAHHSSLSRPRAGQIPTPRPISGHSAPHKPAYTFHGSWPRATFHNCPSHLPCVLSHTLFILYPLFLMVPSSEGSAMQ